jgi:hypothetical protein
MAVFVRRGGLRGETRAPAGDASAWGEPTDDGTAGAGMTDVGVGMRTAARAASATRLVGASLQTLAGPQRQIWLHEGAAERGQPVLRSRCADAPHAVTSGSGWTWQLRGQHGRLPEGDGDDENGYDARAGCAPEDRHRRPKTAIHRSWRPSGSLAVFAAAFADGADDGYDNGRTTHECNGGAALMERTVTTFYFVPFSDGRRSVGLRFPFD